MNALSGLREEASHGDVVYLDKLIQSVALEAKLAYVGEVKPTAPVVNNTTIIGDPAMFERVRQRAEELAAQQEKLKKGDYNLDDFRKQFSQMAQMGGMGQMMKVINNLMSVTALSIASEALVLATKAGLDPDLLIEVVNSGSGSSNATMTKIPKFVLSRSFDFGFAIGLSAKDLRLCLEESDALGVPMIVGSAVRQLLTIAKGKLGPDADLTEIIKPVEDWAGVTVAGARARS